MLKKVMFRSSNGVFFDFRGIDENGLKRLDEKECFRFTNSKGVKCYGSDENGYTIYAY